MQRSLSWAICLVILERAYPSECDRVANAARSGAWHGHWKIAAHGQDLSWRDWWRGDWRDTAPPFPRREINILLRFESVLRERFLDDAQGVVPSYDVLIRSIARFWRPLGAIENLASLRLPPRCYTAARFGRVAPV
jgi:hypothetical protein